MCLLHFNKAPNSRGKIHFLRSGTSPFPGSETASLLPKNYFCTRPGRATLLVPWLSRFPVIDPRSKLPNDARVSSGCAYVFRDVLFLCAHHRPKIIHLRCYRRRCSVLTNYRRLKPLCELREPAYSRAEMIAALRTYRSCAEFVF